MARVHHWLQNPRTVQVRDSFPSPTTPASETPNASHAIDATSDTFEAGVAVGETRDTWQQLTAIGREKREERVKHDGERNEKKTNKQEENELDAWNLPKRKQRCQKSSSAHLNSRVCSRRTTHLLPQTPNPDLPTSVERSRGSSLSAVHQQARLFRGLAMSAYGPTPTSKRARQDNPGSSDGQGHGRDMTGSRGDWDLTIPILKRRWLRQYGFPRPIGLQEGHKNSCSGAHGPTGRGACIPSRLRLWSARPHAIGWCISKPTPSHCPRVVRTGREGATLQVRWKAVREDLGLDS